MPLSLIHLYLIFFFLTFDQKVIELIPIFLSCNFNFSATSKTLNSSSGLPGNNNLDFKYVKPCSH